MIRLETELESLYLFSLGRIRSPHVGNQFEPACNAWVDALHECLFGDFDESLPVLEALAAREGEPNRVYGALDASRQVRDIVCAAATPLAPGEAPAFKSLLETSMALVGTRFAGVYRSHVVPKLDAANVPLVPLREAASALVPATRRFDWVLSGALGQRGRALGQSIYLGAPMPWNALAPEDAVAIALHETSVSVAHASFEREPAQQWAYAERLAIDSLREVLAGTAWLAPYEALLGSWDLTGLAHSSEVRSQIRGQVTRLRQG
jgi:hypothetical protein